MESDKFVFFIDIDNTLLTHGEVCESNIKAIEEARKRGHLVFINTARSYAIIPQSVRDIPFDGYVTSLGNLIMMENDTIYNVTIPHEETAEIFDYFTGSKRSIHLEGEEYFFRNRFSDTEFGVLLESGKELMEKYSSCRISKVYIPYVLPEEECKYLSSKYMFYKHGTYCEYGVAGNTKATGIIRVMDYLKIPVKNSVAIGDSVNDIEMMEASGISIAMGDGNDMVKEMCDIVTCDSDLGGVGEGILRVINGK